MWISWSEHQRIIHYLTGSTLKWIILKKNKTTNKPQNVTAMEKRRFERLSVNRECKAVTCLRPSPWHHQIPEGGHRVRDPGGAHLQQQGRGGFPAAGVGLGDRQGIHSNLLVVPQWADARAAEQQHRGCGEAPERRGHLCQSHIFIYTSAKTTNLNLKKNVSELLKSNQS